MREKNTKKIGVNNFRTQQLKTYLEIFKYKIDKYIK